MPERGGGSRRSGGLERGRGIQTGVVARIARSRPPSPEAMPHGTRRALPANPLAPRCAPSSCSSGRGCGRFLRRRDRYSIGILTASCRAHCLASS